MTRFRLASSQVVWFLGIVLMIPGFMLWWIAEVLQP